MHGIRVLTVALATMSLVVACTASGPRGTEVTRFHLDKPIAPQAVNIEAADGGGKDSLAFSSYSTVIASELRKIGFDAVPGDSAAIVATVGVTRRIQQAAPKRSGFSIGMGGGSYGSGGGIGGGVSMPVGGSGSDEEFVTELKVRLVERGSNTTVWEGTALRATPSGGGSATDVVQQMAAALFQDFPGESGKTVTIE